MNILQLDAWFIIYILGIGGGFLILVIFLLRIELAKKKEASSKSEKRRIVSAAGRGRSGRVIPSPRHCDPTFWAIVDSLSDEEKEHFTKGNIEQGFIDQFGTFHSREQARIIATTQNQIIHRCGNDAILLWSENLY